MWFLLFFFHTVYERLYEDPLQLQLYIEVDNRLYHGRINVRIVNVGRSRNDTLSENIHVRKK